MNHSPDNINRLITEIRRRWKRRALVQGAAITLILLLVLTTVLLLVYTQFEIAPFYQMLGMGAAVLILLGVLAKLVIQPALRRISDRQIALYVEEKMPELQDRLNSAVEIDDTTRLREEHGILLDRLIDDAGRRAKMIPITTIVDRKKERILSYSATGLLALFLFFGLLSFDQLSRSLSGTHILPPAVTGQPFIQVTPGNIEIEQGASQEIIAALREDTEGDVTIRYKVGDSMWQQATMQRGLAGPEYLHVFQDVQQPVQYTVETGERRSGPYTVSLYKFPEVTQIDVTYNYPSYTGRPVRTEEDVGDITGLKGSTVTLVVETSGSVEEAKMVRENGDPLSLKPLGEGRFQVQFTLQQEDFYHIELTDSENRHNKFPQKYRILPIEDEPPYITIADPGRDIRANTVQEVLVAVRVTDDYGVEDVHLRYSINGSEPEAISLMDASEAGTREVTGEHLFFLEMFDLQPGDVISYYVEADDHFSPTPSEATAMYFIEVIPFDQRFSQVNNVGGMGGGGRPSETVLSQQQIISATWNLYRDRNERTPQEFDEARQAIAQAQSNLQRSIEERITSTAFSRELQTSEKAQQIVDALQQAVQQMEEAVARLRDGQLRDALSPEQKALNFVLQAEAMNKERQVALSRARGTGNTSATGERISELMNLELDISQDKYEMPSRRSANQSRQVSETLQKIRELARKQERLLEQRRQQQLRGEDNKRFIERLEREQRQLRRQVEDFSRQMRSQSRTGRQQSQEMERQLQRATEQMQEAGRALRQGDMQQARTHQQQALNELQRLQRDLQIRNTDNAREMLDSFARRFQQLREQERQLGSEMRQAVEQTNRRNGQLNRETVEQLREKRSALVEQLQQLKQDAEAIQEQTRADHPDLAADMENLRQQMQQNNLEEMMRASEQALAQGWLDYARRLQGDIEGAMERLESDMQTLEQQLPVTEKEQLARSLQQVRDLMDQMEALEQQSRSLRQSNGQQSRAETVRLQRQLQQARQSLEQLQQNMEGRPEARRQVGRVLEFIRTARADHTGVLLDEETADEFFNENAYDPLAQLELALARQLDAIEMENKLYGARQWDVPREYRRLVETYYERLSKSSNAQ